MSSLTPLFCFVRLRFKNDGKCFLFAFCYESPSISASHPDSTFDLALSGILEPNTSIHSTETLGEICRVLKPQGRLILGEAVTGDKSDESKVKSTEKLNSSLKLSGYVNIEQVSL